MNEVQGKSAEEGRPSAEGYNTLKMAPPVKRARADELLNIAKRIDQFITDNGWPWCDMRQVYRILETIHG